MDPIDRSILTALRRNSRASISSISAEVHLSVPAVAERIRKLEHSGAIRAYTVRTDPRQQGYLLLAFVLVNIDSTENVLPFREEIVRCPEVLECHHIAGQADYLLKVLVQDTLDMEHFLMEKLKQLPGVSASNTFITLSTLKEEMGR